MEKLNFHHRQPHAREVTAGNSIVKCAWKQNFTDGENIFGHVKKPWFCRYHE
ncbi:hypothetical protein [Methylomonas albis]|nr:hypothetical protein [Methylomonas albis]